MWLILLFISLQFHGGDLVRSGDRIARKIRVVCPDVSSAVAGMMAEEIVGFSHVVPEDVAISVAWVETRCTHLKKRGAAGEWGILQVIPYEGHILTIAEEYRCTADEQGERVLVGGAQIALCEADGRLNVRRSGAVIPWRFEAVMKGNARVAFRVGLRELGVWKRQYENVLYGKFWRVYPAWMENRVPDPVGFRGWWYSVRAELGSAVWVVHHNYGPRLVSGAGPRSYPFKVLQGMRQLRGVE